MRPQSEVIRLTDGTAFAVFWRHGQIAVAAPHGDPVLAETLSPYGVGYDLAEGTTIHAGMSAETVRAYCRAHGGVVPGGGSVALHLLKELAELEKPVAATPPARDLAPRPRPAIDPALTPRQRAQARDAQREIDYRVAVPHVAAAERWTPPQVPRLVGPRLPYVKPSELQDAVKAARELVAKAAAPPTDRRVLGRYSASCAGSASRLRMAENSVWSEDPLRDEALALRVRLIAIQVETHNRSEEMLHRELGLSIPPHRIEHAHD